MSDTRAAIRELRSLSEKRSTQGLTEQERSRLAELRERLGLPSEPAETRPDGVQAGGSPAPSAPVASAAPVASSSRAGDPLLAAALPRLDASGPALLRQLDDLESPGTLAAEPVPGVEASSPLELAREPALALEPDLPPSGITAAEAPLQLEPVPGAESGVLPPELTTPEEEPAPDPAEVAMAESPPGFDTALPLEPDVPPSEIAAAEDQPVLDPPLPDAPLADASAVLPAGVASPGTLPVLDAVALEPDVPPSEIAPAEAQSGAMALESAAMGSAAEPGEVAAVPVSDATTDPAIELRALEPAVDLTQSATWPDPEAQETASGLDAAAVPEQLQAERVPVGAPVEIALPETEPAPDAPPRRPSLAERIDAAVESQGALDAGSEPLDGLTWGTGPIAPAPLAPEDLGATPLDVAEPAAEFGLGGDAVPIELSSADVILLEGESAVEADLGGQPEDPVPLAGLHEFVGEQPEDPRALAFDDPGEQPAFAPEELQATEAELAADPQAFHPESVEALPELEPEPAPPPPAPAAPRIVLPRPPPAPPPARPAAVAALPPEPPAAPAPRPPPAPRAVAAAPAAPRAVGAPTATAPPVTAGTRTPSPPPPPAGAFVLGEDGRRLPALSPARPEPPQLVHRFANSGPFARNRAVPLSQASLDVMEEGEPMLAERTPPPPVATDVATGAEVFGGAYLSPTFVEGEHRVVLHTLEGQVRRGTVKDLDLLDPVIRLTQPGRAPEPIPSDRVKAIFFMQEPGTPPPPSTGRRVRVGFADGRQIVGFSEDVDSAEQGFFLVPADTRTHTARIYVFRAGVQSISAA